MRFFVIIFLFTGIQAFAQNDSTPSFRRITPGDSITNQDAIYDRPFITLGRSRTAVGGYMEGNTNYFAEDGVTDGFTMEMRRFNIFFYSSIHPKIKFLSELEFEHGTEEISLETALLDFELNQALNFRAGIILPQIGIFNANHDSPKWEFVDRPLSSTELIPTTLSEIGFGFHGKFYAGSNILSYDAYLVNGLQEGVVFNTKGRTSLASGKSPEMFAEDNNGTPMYNARLAFVNRKIGEAGISYYGGTYNRFRIEGIQVEPRQNLSILAADFSTSLGKLKIQGELVKVNVELPETASEVFGSAQWGGFADLIYPVLKRKMLRFDNAVLNISTRIERADFNLGTFSFNDSKIRDELTATSFAIGFRPVPGTVIRFNYRYIWKQDMLGNPMVHIGGYQIGVASYF